MTHVFANFKQWHHKRISLRFEVDIKSRKINAEGISQQRIEDMQATLRELGLDDEVSSM